MGKKRLHSDDEEETVVETKSHAKKHAKAVHHEEEEEEEKPSKKHAKAVHHEEEEEEKPSKKHAKAVHHEEEEEEEKPTKKKSRKEEIEEQANNGCMATGKPLSDFQLSSGTVEALQKQGITTLFPVQALTYDGIMKGTDVLVQARTGSGKTLAFGIPIVEKLAQNPSKSRGRGPAAVVFCPTRELAIQVKDVIAGISRGYIVSALYGGVAYSAQESILRGGVDVIVATPGRAKDMLEKGTLKFDRVSIAVLDEADHMLDIGFKDDIELLLRKVSEQNGSQAGQNTHQTLLFSATVPDWVHKCSFISKNKEFVDMVGRDTVKTANTIRFYRRKCLPSEIPSMLADLIRVYSGKHGRTLVFTNTKKDCHDLTVNNSIKLDAQALHGDMQQEQRESTMKSFRENKFSVLIATDVAARGLDLPMVDLVIQAAPPSDIDSFIHRAGRTGRAGRKGVCVLLHMPREEYVVDKIERHSKMKFEVLPSPSHKDILNAVARDVTEDLARVERKATELFREAAENLMKEADPIEILASALAVMSGYTENITRRGLLTGAENHATVRMDSSNPLPVPVYCSILRNNLGDDLFMRCRDITLLQDEPGCVFDVADTFVDRVLGSTIRGMTMTMVEDLPPIIARELQTGRGRGGGGGFGGRGGGRGFGGRGGGGFGGRGGGGFGGGRGGGGFRGRRY